jgi:hypothetical protein
MPREPDKPPPIVNPRTLELFSLKLEQVSVEGRVDSLVGNHPRMEALILGLQEECYRLAKLQGRLREVRGRILGNRIGRDGKG